VRAVTVVAHLLVYGVILHAVVVLVAVPGSGLVPLENPGGCETGLDSVDHLGQFPDGRVFRVEVVFPGRRILPADRLEVFLQRE